MKHQDIPSGYIHQLHNWDYADAAARTAATGFVAGDVDKWAIQRDTPATYWRLTDHSPITWEQITADVDTLAGQIDDLTDAVNKGLFATRLAKTGAYTVIAADRGALIEATAGTWTLALTAAATLASGFAFGAFNSGSGVITIDADGAETIRDATSSATTKTLTQGEAAIIMCDGTGFMMMKFAASGAGGSVDISGTPTTGQVAEFIDADTVQGVSVTGTGNYVKANSPILVTPNLGTPSALVLTNATGFPVLIQLACSDETTSLTTGTGKVTFRAPYAFTLTGVRASVTTAPTGGTLLTIDINEAGTTVLSTKLTFDASEKTTTTAATAAVISDGAIADDAEISIDIDAVGSTIAGAGLKVTLIGTRP